jgi:hypothetical protein
MNLKMHRNNFPRCLRICAALLAGIFLLPTLRAQPTEQTVQGRLLLVFETSSDMKKRLPAVEKALNQLLATSMVGELHSGDSIGVWTFDQNLHAGEFPLQIWNPDKAVQTASAIMKFAGKQRYAKNATLTAVQPLLNRVVDTSERLTVLIFCDGESPISGTPFDDGVNQTVQQKQADQKSAEEPVVILLRSQLGKYTGCTVSLPPQSINLPPFPPLPLPSPPPAPKPTIAAPPPAPAVVVPSLIIIGTNFETRLPPPVTNSVPINSVATNETAVPSTPQTNASAALPTNAIETTVIAPKTNSPASSPENSGSGDGKYFIIGGGLFGVAVVLGIFLWLRSQRKDTSLITRSMNERR